MNQKLTEKTLFTEQGQLIGTPAYMSARAGGDVGDSTSTRAADVYSLGVLLYELLTGERPFSSDTKSLMELGFAEMTAYHPR